MLTFMARIRSENALSAGEVSRGVGVDEHTALLLDTITGDVAAVGVGTAYVCSTDHDAELCVAETPLTFHCKNNLQRTIRLCLTVPLCHSCFMRSHEWK